MIDKSAAAVLVFCAALAAAPGQVSRDSSSGPLLVVDTSKGTFVIETFPADAPKTVAHIVDLTKRRFYDGQRFHRVAPGFLIQWGDPRSRSLEARAAWGRGEAASSGQPIGVSEMTKKRMHVEGAVGVSHAGNPARADSQIYVMLADRHELDGRYTIFGRIVSGLDVAERIEIGDVITRMSVTEPETAARP